MLNKLFKRNVEPSVPKFKLGDFVVKKYDNGCINKPAEITGKLKAHDNYFYQLNHGKNIWSFENDWISEKSLVLVTVDLTPIPDISQVLVDNAVDEQLKSRYNIMLKEIQDLAVRNFQREPSRQDNPYLKLQELIQDWVFRI